MLQFTPPKFAQFDAPHHVAESAGVLFTPLRLKLNNVRKTDKRKRKLKQYDVRGSYK